MQDEDCGKCTAQRAAELCGIALIGSTNDFEISELFIVYGWNQNDELDEIDEVESNCYITLRDAEQELDEMKDRYCRKGWCVDKYTIDECCWQEGFVKNAAKVCFGRKKLPAEENHT